MSRGSGYPECMQDLIDSFAKMPGVGIRTAERLAFYVLTADPTEAHQLSQSVKNVKDNIQYCKNCFNLSENELCHICDDPTRDQSILCVVEEPKDIISIEKSGAFHGLYHILLGSLSPLDGVGPQDIKISELIKRIKTKSILEIILATTSDTEGEATAIYISNALKDSQVKITRLAQGVPLGSELEFTDRATLIRAIEARNEVKT